MIWTADPYRVDELGNWDETYSFRIVDERYKPVEQKPQRCKLEPPERLPNMRCAYNIKLDEKPSDTDEVVYVTGKKDLSDASLAIADAINALTDCGEIESAHKLQEINRGILAKQKAQLADIERKRVVDAALDVWQFSKSKATYKSTEILLADLYDKGYLRMPEDK
jgi:hypothetical protein